ncbi:hypothetical protein [Methylobacterium oryzisoli]|uniref:hypothetical protein n=1 Tax=Methylobacterium oryzisoli TaxID=3385502 RepID=UPI00389171B2
MKMNLARLVRRPADEPRPSLRERAAALKASAARVILRPVPAALADHAKPVQAPPSLDRSVPLLGPDAALICETRDLAAIEAAQEALLANGDYADAYDAPAWVQLEGWRETIFSRINATRAQTLSGLRAKAGLFSLECVSHHQQAHEQLALSLAADLNGMGPQAAAELDPIFAAIEHNCEGMYLRQAAMEATAASSDRNPDLVRAREEAGDESWRRWNALLEVRPTTAAGARALARHVLEWMEEQGEDGPETADYRKALALIGSDVVPADAGAATPRPIAPPAPPPPAVTIPGLSRCTIDQLIGLFDVYARAMGTFHTSAFWPKVGEAGSELLTGEGDRCETLMHAVEDELRRRVPKDASESDEKAERLAYILMQRSDWQGVRRVAAQAEAEIAAFEAEF